MKSLKFWFALLAGFFIATSLQAAEKTKTLIITGGHGFQKEPFFKVFQDNPNITFTHAAQGKTAEAYEREDLLTYDVVVLYDYMLTNITEVQKSKFLSLFDKGTGLVVLHHALCSYQNWPEYEKIVGGKYLMKEEVKEGDMVFPSSDYQHDVDYSVQVVAKDHPITAGVKDFKIHDEIYKRYRVLPNVTPLITTDHSESGKPLMWAKHYKKSKVVYLQLGHDQAAYNDSNYRTLVGRAITWVTPQGSK
jgi:uncharacterized protein